MLSKKTSKWWKTMIEIAYLLDTNAAVALLENDPVMTALVTAQPIVYLSSIVIGELYYGAEKSSRVEANIERISHFLGQGIILYCDAQTARWYGRINHQLRSQGSPIPQNDVWIAATALQHDLTLLTRDGHFDHVAGLKKAAW